MLQSGQQGQKWPTSGPGVYITPAASEIPSGSERGTKSEVAHKWAEWLHTSSRLGGLKRFRAGDEISNDPQMGQLAT